MASFYIGQRVRIVSCRHPDMMHHVGTEDVIVRHCVDYEDSFDLEKASKCADGWPCSWSSESLEPISDSNQLSSWEAMKDIWVPDEMRAGA